MHSAHLDNPIRAKDFIETHDGLLFAVLAVDMPCERVVGCLRYRRCPTGLVKLTTLQAQSILEDAFPNYLFNCAVRDVRLPGIGFSAIARHFRPADELRCSTDPLVQRAADLLAPLGEHVGITGSRLIGAQTAQSDIDLVIYGRDNFETARNLLDAAIARQVAQPLSQSQWQADFQRRQCQALSFAEYRWHEMRKRNKVSLDGTKLDISCLAPTPDMAHSAGKKLGPVTIQARVTDDRFGFTTPALYQLDHIRVLSLVIHTATYLGQALIGETIEARGELEQTEAGLRLIIGASREADGQYVKVIRSSV